MVDRDLILRKIADIDLYLEQVRSYRDIQLDTYRARVRQNVTQE